MIRLVTACFLLSTIASAVFAQNQPHVDEVMKSLDANKDGSLSNEEVAKSRQYSRQFPRWDTDNDGEVSRADIVKFRARFGIMADGTRRRREANENTATRPFTIPDIDSLPRIGKGTRLNRAAAANSQFVLKTEPHDVEGQAYVVLTDHTDARYLKTLGRFVSHHDAKLVQVEDLAILHEQADHFNRIRNQLDKARFVAIAPRLESLRENMVLGAWELLSTLDEDPHLDCFPGFLVASNHASFERLIDQSIRHRPISAEKLKPFAINQVQNSRETRSLQKSGILRKHFQTVNIKTPIVAIYGKDADTAPRLKGEQTWNVEVESKRKFVTSFSDPINEALKASNLIMMHGHGIPGMSCSMDVDAIPKDCRGKVLLSGSCFSANPVQSDLAALNEAPGGYSVQPRDAFILRAVDNGAVAAFGHQRLSSGFPHLYPVLESWLNGQSVGQAYQQLINGLIDQRGTRSGGFVLSKEQRTGRSPGQQRFLYLIIGDPSLQPFERVTFPKPAP